MGVCVCAQPSARRWPNNKTSLSTKWRVETNLKRTKLNRTETTGTMSNNRWAVNNRTAEKSMHTKMHATKRTNRSCCEFMKKPFITSLLRTISLYIFCFVLLSIWLWSFYIFPSSCACTFHSTRRKCSLYFLSFFLSRVTIWFVIWSIATTYFDRLNKKPNEKCERKKIK